MPTVRAPASIAALMMLGGLALIYWALQGLGVIEGDTPSKRVASVKDKLTNRE